MVGFHGGRIDVGKHFVGELCGSLELGYDVALVIDLLQGFDWEL